MQNLKLQVGANITVVGSKGMSESEKAALLVSLPPLTIHVNGQAITAAPRQFSTGSIGYYVNGKALLALDLAA